MYSLVMYYSYLIFTKYLDKGILEILGPFGFYKFFKTFNNKLYNSISPLIFFYIYIFFLCLSLFIFALIIINIIDVFLLLSNLFFLILLSIIFLI